MIQFNLEPTSLGICKTRRFRLTRWIAAGLCAFATAFGAQGATIQLDSSGSILSQPIATDRSAVGALTLRPFEAAAPAFVIRETAPVALFGSTMEDALLVPAESAHFAHMSRLFEPTTWLVALLASVPGLWLARTQLTRRRLVPIQNA